MPRQTWVGSDLPALFILARNTFGPDAVIHSVRRIGPGRFELVATAPGEAGAVPADRPVERRPRRPHRPSSIPGSATSMKPLLTSSWRRRGSVPAVVALVGPTGSGKTTTIAKLAAHPAVFGGLPVGLLCLDTYRIGAVEQSRIYSELARLPFEVAYAPGEIAGAFRRLRGCEIILVDTPGRGPRQAADAADTRALIEGLSPVEVHLTLPAGLTRESAERVVHAHRGLGVTHLLPTKLDEHPDEDTAFDLAADLGLPMRWITDGQEVPMDLRSAAERLAMASGHATLVEVA